MDGSDHFQNVFLDYSFPPSHTTFTAEMIDFKIFNMHFDFKQHTAKVPRQVHNVSGWENKLAASSVWQYWNMTWWLL